MAKDFGTGVSVERDAEDIAQLLVIFQRNQPPTDAELNLVGQINTEERQKIIRSLMPSGWVNGPSKSRMDFYFHESFTNFFYMGRQNEQETVGATVETPGIRNLSYANVNGWVIPVTGTQVNNITTLNDDDFRNKVLLPFGPTSGWEANFIFLEVWQALVAPTPSTANKPTGSTLYKWGNVEFGGTNPPEELIPPDVGVETTNRIQLQYRIRMVSDVDIVTHPTGFTNRTAVFARANLTEGGAVDLANLIDTGFYPVSGDEGLWRSGDGDPSNGLGSVDGYTYAIPILAVSRRNRGGYSLTTINGGVSRRSPPTGYVEGAPDTGCPLTPAEILASPDSDRPDGKHVDLIVAEDITDMRHHVSPVAHNYEDILEEALNALLNNNLAVSPKMSTVGGVQYSPRLMYTDEITAGSDNPATITIGEPDGVRRLYTDVPVPQARNHFGIGPTEKSVSSPSFGTDPTRWMPGDIIEVPHPTSLNSADFPTNMLTNNFKITYRGSDTPIVADFVTSATASTLVATGAFTNFFATDASQFQGYALEITGGTGVGQVQTISNIDSANQITLIGTFSTIPTATSSFVIRPLIIEATATADTNFLTIIITSINGDTSFTSTDISTANLIDDMWVEYTVHYPAGQGMSLRADNIYQVNYTNPTATVLVAPTSDPSKNMLLPRYINHSSDFVNPTIPVYFGSDSVSADCYVDEGSKTVVVQPWQLVTMAIQPRQLQTFSPSSNNYYGLFDTQFALEVPRPLLPALGASAIPIIAAASGVFFTGLHVWCFNETDAGGEVVINLMGRSNFDDDAFVGTTVFARQDDIAYEASVAGAPTRVGCRVNAVVGGIELPQYIGIARVIGVFERSDFDVNSVGGTNLLNFHPDNASVVPNVWIDRTPDHTDVSFTLMEGAIAGFVSTNEYVIVCNTFGFREGFIYENALVAAHEQVSGVSDSVTLQVVVPQGLPTSAVVQVTYDRTPYQGSIFNRLEPFADTTPEPFNNRGLVSDADLADLDVPLVDSPTQGSIFHYEVLATKEFVSSLGTARFSGVGNGRFYKEKRIGSGFPVGAPRFESLALSDVHLDRAGFITRLPLGARYRDADFAGEDIFSGNGAGPHLNYSGETNPSTLIYSERTPSEPLGAGQIITVTEGNLGAPSDNSRYRTTRGGSGYLQDDGQGNAGGGPIVAGSHDVRIGFKVLKGVVSLIRTFDESAPENFDLPFDAVTNPNVLKGRGGELQMVVMTSVHTPIYDLQGVYEDQTVNAATSPTGVGEGDVAIDRYRVRGRPLEHQPLLAPFTEQAPIIKPTSRLGEPSILSVFPDRVAPEDAVVVRGALLAVVSSPGTADGAEIFARRQDRSTAQPLVDLTPYVVDTAEGYIVFKTPGTDVLGAGLYDIVVRAGDGQLATALSALTADAAVTNGHQIRYLNNFAQWDNGSFPATESGISTNATGSFRVTNVASRVANQSGFFKGIGRAGTDLARISTASPSSIFGTESISIRFSFKLVSATIDTGNVIQIIHQAVELPSTFVDIFQMSLTAATSFFTFTVFDVFTGSGDVTFAAATVLDTAWHDVEFFTDANDLNRLSFYFDGKLIFTGVPAGAAVFATTHLPIRLEMNNTATAAVTTAQYIVDRLVLQNYFSPTILL